MLLAKPYATGNEILMMKRVFVKRNTDERVNTTQPKFGVSNQKFIKHWHAMSLLIAIPFYFKQRFLLIYEYILTVMFYQSSTNMIKTILVFNRVV